MVIIMEWAEAQQTRKNLLDFIFQEQLEFW